MKVHELAERAGVTPHVVRYYVRIGLLRPERLLKNGYKEFAEGDVRRLRFIRRSQYLGFTLAEIAEIISKSAQGETPCPTVREIVARRVTDSELELEALVELRNRMKRALAQWKRMPDRLPNGNTICHLIESVDVR
jgi:DNA-binding transcriptional MerR regulator